MEFNTISSVGAQNLLWHRAGVAKMTATGLPAPITRSSDTVWSGHAGWRVQMGFTPSASAVVGDGARGAACPGAGMVGVAPTAKASGEIAFRFRVMWASQLPALSNVPVVEYTPLPSRPSPWKAAATGA